MDLRDLCCVVALGQVYVVVFKWYFNTIQKRDICILFILYSTASSCIPFPNLPYKL